MKASISLNEPEFDKNAFIRSYLETQKVYAAARAVQTPRVIAAASSYIDPADPLDKPPENTERPNRDYARARAEKDGSASVLLQPRAPAQPASHPPTKPARSTATAKLHDTVFNSSNRHQGVESSHQRSASPPAPPRKAQPRRNMENSDPEYTARLTERHERKRARRAITHPEHIKEASRSKTHASDDASDAPRAASKPKTKMAKGMSLMHGFTADNVGSNRITLRPVDRAGVFQKGKSSAKISTSGPRKNTRRLELFNEVSFLNKISVNNIAPSTEPEDDSSSSISASVSARRRKYRITNVMNKKRRVQNSESDTASPRRQVPQEASSLVGLVSRAPTPVDRESVVWDIEKGLDLPDSSVVGAQDLRGTRANTVLMNTREVRWSTGLHQEANTPIARPSSPSPDFEYDEIDDDAHDKKSPGTRSSHRRSPSTLAPWHSASQCGISHPVTVPTRPFLRQSSRHSPIERSVSIEPPPMVSYDCDDPQDDIMLCGQDEVDDDDAPMPFHQTLQPTMVTRGSSARLDSPAMTIDSFQAALQRYEADDQSAVHPLPHYYAAAMWRSVPDFDLSSYVSDGRPQPSPTADYAESAFDGSLEAPSSGSALGSTVELLHMMNVHDSSQPPFTLAANTLEYGLEDSQFVYDPARSWSPPADLGDLSMAISSDVAWADLPVSDPRYFGAEECTTNAPGYAVQDAYESNCVDSYGPYSPAMTELSYQQSHDGSTLGTPSQPPTPLPHYQFSQGQHLLQAFARSGDDRIGYRALQAELDVAVSLRDHWYPIRP